MHPSHKRLENRYQSERIVRNRLIIVTVVILLMMVGIVARLFFLQVIEHQHHMMLSEDNRIQVLPIPPTRGLIKDRNGKLLAMNVPASRLVYLGDGTGSLEPLLDHIAGIVSFSDEKRAEFYKRLKQRRRPRDPVSILENLSDEEAARLSVNKFWLKDVAIEAELIRHYPHGESLAHVLGYVGRINQKEQERIDRVKYSGTRFIGKLGVEKHYESFLLGDVGNKWVEADARGHIRRTLKRELPTAGSEIQLSLDLELQKVAVKAMDGRRGAVVALDPRTGDVLAMASTPSFDPNLFVTGISTKNYSALRDDIDQPLYNRALRGQYPPGSTVKPMNALAGLYYDITTKDRTIYDPGFFRLPGHSHRFRDWKKEGHGKVNLATSIIQSCDIYYYDLGHKMGIEKLAEFSGMFGLGKRQSRDMPEEKAGLMPTPAWKKRRFGGAAWYPGETVIASIGQGYVLATPLQLATMTAILANRGAAIQPGLVPFNGESYLLPPVTESLESVSIPRSEDWDVIHQAMEDVVHSRKGTAYWAMGRHLKYRMAGKTGTAQVFTVAQNEEYNEDEVEERKRDHALFVAFAPAENPVIAISVIVENGGHGSTVASPVAEKVATAWLTEFAPEKDRVEVLP